MKTILSVLCACLLAGPASAGECDCTSYPFQPNPPCYGKCIARLTAADISMTQRVRNIDPAVVDAITTLKTRSATSTVDFAAIGNERDLEQAAASTRPNVGGTFWASDSAVVPDVTADAAAASDSSASTAEAAEQAAAEAAEQAAAEAAAKSDDPFR